MQRRRAHKTTRALLARVVALLLAMTIEVMLATAVLAQAATILSPREASDALRAGSIFLLDIRTPTEWADTGVPQGAVPLDSETPGFEVRLAGFRLDNPGRRVVLIDRTGALAASVRQKLAGRGWRDLAIVGGGMLGPSGWLAEKLPVAAYP